MTSLLPEPFPNPSEPGCIDQIESNFVEKLESVPTPGAAYLDLALHLADTALAGIDLPKTRVALIALGRGYGGAARTKRDLVDASQKKVPKLVERIRKMIEGSDQAIPGVRTHLSTGTFGDIVQSLLEVVWHTTLYPDKYTAVAELLPALVAAYPGMSSSLVWGMLEDHPTLAEAAAKVLTSQMEAGKAGKEGLTTVAHDLFGLYASRDDPIFRAAPRIMKLLPDPLPISDEDTRRIFVEDCLDIAPTTATEEIARRRDRIKWALRKAEGFAPKRPNSIMPSTLAAKAARDRIASDEAEIMRLETDFDGWVQKKRDAAVRRLVVAKSTRRAYETLARKAGPLTRSLIKELLAEGDAIANRPRTYAIPSPPDKAFHDFGFKLLVIEELMFQQEVIAPKLDLDIFAREYLERNIDRETDGYGVIPEIAKYLKALPIAPEALSLVTGLHQSSGMDGGAEVYHALWPFFDAGGGDTPIAVTNRAVQDLALVPNLKTISGLENSAPSPKLVKALTAAGVMLVNEEEATFGKK